MKMEMDGEYDGMSNHAIENRERLLLQYPLEDFRDQAIENLETQIQEEMERLQEEAIEDAR